MSSSEQHPSPPVPPGGISQVFPFLIAWADAMVLEDGYALLEPWSTAWQQELLHFPNIFHGTHLTGDLLLKDRSQGAGQLPELQEVISNAE